MIRLNNHNNLFTDVKKIVVSIQSKFERLRTVDLRIRKQCMFDIFRKKNDF